MSVRRVRSSTPSRAALSAFLTGAAVGFYTAAASGVLIYFGLTPYWICLLAALAGVIVALFASRLVRREWDRARRRRIASVRREGRGRRIAAAVETGFAVRENREERESREIQAALLPAVAPAIDGYHVEVAYEPCGSLGGDFYDFLPQPDGRLLFTLGDVSGKGSSGAIVMAMVQTLFRQNAPQALGPADLLRRVNDGFQGTLGKGVFVTALVAVLDPALHRITLAGAGHHPVLLLNPGLRRSTRVSARGLALGLVAGQTFSNELVETTVDVALGDSLLLYTDGAIDNAHTLASEIGENRFLAAAAASVLPGPRRALDRLRADLRQGDGLVDDLTLLLVARTETAVPDRLMSDRSTGNLKI